MWSSKEEAAIDSLKLCLSPGESEIRGTIYFYIVPQFFYLFAIAATSVVVAIDEDPVLLGFLNKLIGEQ